MRDRTTRGGVLLPRGPLAVKPDDGPRIAKKKNGSRAAGGPGPPLPPLCPRPKPDPPLVGIDQAGSPSQQLASKPLPSPGIEPFRALWPGISGSSFPCWRAKSVKGVDSSSRRNPFPGRRPSPRRRSWAPPSLDGFQDEAHLGLNSVLIP